MSPTTDPAVIPVGLATKVGQIVGSGFALVAAVTTVVNGDLTEETVTAMILSALTFLTLMGGRYFQAGMLLRNSPVGDTSNMTFNTGASSPSVSTIASGEPEAGDGDTDLPEHFSDIEPDDPKGLPDDEVDLPDADPKA